MKLTATARDATTRTPPAQSSAAGTIVSSAHAPVGSEAGSMPCVDDDRYELLGEIARGGMGRIVKAYDRRHQRFVALKFLLRADAASSRRFLRETRITARLQHPSIVTLHEAGRWTTGEPFFAMKLVDGRSLDATTDEATTMSARLGLLPHLVATTEALAYAHSRGIVHRDLKPSNVLVGAFGETVVVDWGLAGELGEDQPRGAGAGADRAWSADAEGDALTVSGKAMGTPHYMPPEQAEGEVVDARADVYALGAMAYHVMAGRPPYAGASAAETLRLVRAGPPAPLEEVSPDVPAELAAIVRRAMAREAQDRYPSAGEMAADLTRFARGQLVTAHRYSISGLARRWARRNRHVVAVASASLVALALAGALSVRRVVRERDRADAATLVAERARVGADTQRQAAEDLVDFVLGRLRDRLEPIGRLDLMSGVGTEVDRYYRHVQAEGDRGDSPTLDRRAAALETLASVEQKKRQVAEAESLWTLAIALRERSSIAAPTNDDTRAHLVDDERALAQIGLDLEHADDADAHVQRARALCDARSVSHDAPRWRAKGAMIDSLEAGVLHLRGRDEDAVALSQKAVAIMKDVASSNDDGLRDLGRLEMNLAIDQRALLRDEDAETSLIDSVDVWRRGLARAPDDTEQQRYLAWSLSLLSNVRMMERRLPEALASAEEARGIRERLARLEPANEVWAREVMDSDNELSAIAALAGKDTDAVRFAREGLAIARRMKETAGPLATVDDVIAMEIGLGDAELRAGHVADALADARSAVEKAAAAAESAPADAERAHDETAAMLLLAHAELAAGAVDASSATYLALSALLPRLARGPAHDAAEAETANVGAEARMRRADLDGAERRLEDAFRAHDALTLAKVREIELQIDTARIAFSLAAALRRARSGDAKAHALEARARRLVQPAVAKGLVSEREKNDLRKAGFVSDGR